MLFEKDLLLQKARRNFWGYLFHWYMTILKSTVSWRVKKSTERVFAYLLMGSARLLLSTKTLHDQTVVTLACFKRKCCSLVLYLFYSNFDGVVIGQDVYFNYPLSPDHLPNCEHRLTVSSNNSNVDCRIVSWNSWIQKSSNLRNT